MDAGKPSATAFSSAAARAAHLVADDEPRIFADTVAARLLGGRADEMIGYHRAQGAHIILAGTRAITTVRSRYTEERLGGHTQYVILGAGLDTYGYRGDAGVKVFEVDCPATQEWKKSLLESAGIPVPASVAFVPVDFESDDLVARLEAAGLDAERPALVSWLGVSFYLTREAVAATLARVGRLAPGTELVMDYALPAGLRDAEGDAYGETAERVVAESGEPYRTAFAPGDIDALLKGHGADVAENVRLADAVPPELWRRTDSLRPFDYFRLVRAVVTG
ncbi:class I SAM-dependent methyltransferase [Actinomadura syzygii]|uniref:S-adenosyl-L-methionine-dependent methyltransferase n=1 Tax=Actinomadura syzygii TaxID=1427538 RepID=A0A5D0TUL8_9ACTN|nr:class I SAM-dependent methyltransferase [Actinomadura syzygii]TYC09878.1 class I SAM-dependent methyltransferase [Actinomadura syzygii]